MYNIFLFYDSLILSNTYNKHIKWLVKEEWSLSDSKPLTHTGRLLVEASLRPTVCNALIFTEVQDLVGYHWLKGQGLLVYYLHALIDYVREIIHWEGSFVSRHLEAGGGQPTQGRVRSPTLRRHSKPWGDLHGKVVVVFKRGLWERGHTMYCSGSHGKMWDRMCPHFRVESRSALASWESSHDDETVWITGTVAARILLSSMGWRRRFGNTQQSPGAAASS